MAIELGVMDHIRTAQQVDSLPDQWNVEKVHLGLARDMDGLFTIHGQLYVPEVSGFRGLRSGVLHEVHAPRCAVHLGTTKMYHDVYRTYWLPGLKRDMVDFVVRCLICQ